MWLIVTIVAHYFFQLLNAQKLTIYRQIIYLSVPVLDWRIFQNPVYELVLRDLRRHI